MCKAAIEFALGLFERADRQRRKVFRSTRGLEGHHVVPSQETSLQLAGPIPALDTQRMGLALKVVLYPKLVKPS